jgi:hypothetical protein
MRYVRVSTGAGPVVAVQMGGGLEPPTERVDSEVGLCAIVGGRMSRVPQSEPLATSSATPPATTSRPGTCSSATASGSGATS